MCHVKQFVVLGSKRTKGEDDHNRQGGIGCHCPIEMPIKVHVKQDHPTVRIFVFDQLQNPKNSVYSAQEPYDDTCAIVLPRLVK